MLTCDSAGVLYKNGRLFRTRHIPPGCASTLNFGGAGVLFVDVVVCEEGIGGRLVLGFGGWLIAVWGLLAWCFACLCKRSVWLPYCFWLLGCRTNPKKRLHHLMFLPGDGFSYRN